MIIGNVMEFSRKRSGFFWVSEGDWSTQSIRDFYFNSLNYCSENAINGQLVLPITVKLIKYRLNTTTWVPRGDKLQNYSRRLLVKVYPQHKFTTCKLVIATCCHVQLANDSAIDTHRQPNLAPSIFLAIHLPSHGQFISFEESTLQRSSACNRHLRYLIARLSDTHRQHQSLDMNAIYVATNYFYFSWSWYVLLGFGSTCVFIFWEL